MNGSILIIVGSVITLTIGIVSLARDNLKQRKNAQDWKELCYKAQDRAERALGLVKNK